MQRQSLAISRGLTKAQLVPKLKMAYTNFPALCFIAEHDIIWYRLAHWLVLVICMVVFPPAPVHPQSIYWGGAE